MAEKKKPRRKIRAEQYMVVGFAGLIALGTLLLYLPFSTVEGESTSLVDALFTATTSVCVTGLVTVPTALHWTLFGKIVILLLIQLGGLGIIACMTLTFLVLRKRISLGTRKLIADAYNLDRLQGVVKLVRRIIIGTLTVEILGTIPYAVVFVPEYGVGGGLFRAFFNSVSCFCNAGIDILGTDSLAAYVTDPIININTILLIILGGIGFTVWFDVGARIKDSFRRRTLQGFWSKLELHSRLAISITAILIFGGTVLILLFDWHHGSSLGPLSAGDKVLAALFQSVTTRTAGFQTILQENFTDATAAVCLVLMFIGGSPMGTAGGMKTTTIGILILLTAAYLKGEEEPVIFKRRLRQEDIRAALVVILCGFTVAFAGTILLIVTSDASYLDALYEVVSAVATVGLSRSLTGTLGTASKLIIILIMYAGRLGPISLAMAITRKAKKTQKFIQYPEKRILIG